MTTIVRTIDATGAMIETHPSDPAEVVKATGLDATDVLLPYQRSVLEAISANRVVLIEKSRRVGITWGVAPDACVTAASRKSAGGQDVFYVGYNLEMAREFIDTCASWSRAFGEAAAAVEEVVFNEKDGNGGERAIKAFRISYDSGFEILALPSLPRALRGRQGKVLIDEAAFHDDLDELIKAALALLMWGGSVVIWSTHDGVDNTFNELITECRSGKRPFKVVTITFDDAVRDGLFRRICLMRGKPWSPEAEASWVKEIRDFYGDAAAEELDCVPRKGGGRFLARALLESRAVDVPVLRWTSPAGFVDFDEERRMRLVEEWCETEIAPLLAALKLTAEDEIQSFVGQDFARSLDLSVMWPLVVDARLHRHTPFVIELRDMPHTSQAQVLFYLCDGLPRFAGAALDAGGNGSFLAETARQKYGPEMVHQVVFSETWYREHMPPMKAAIEDGTADIAKNAAIIDDFRQIVVVKGIARVRSHTKSDEGKRHGDAAIAFALAYYASRMIEGGVYEDFIVEGQRHTFDALTGGGRSSSFAGWEPDS